MPREKPLDLYAILTSLTATASWIEEIQIFGSRRYLSNVSYGSDIDLLFIPNKEVSVPELLNVIDEPYLDAFLVVGGVAVSAENQGQIPFGSSSEKALLNPRTIWTRSDGWQTNEDYRILNIFADKAPTKTVPGVRPILILCALPIEFDAVVKRLASGAMRTHKNIPPYYKSSVRTNSNKERLVVVVRTGVASVNAAIACTRILEYFESPELAVLVGITAGIRRRRDRRRRDWLSDLIHRATQWNAKYRAPEKTSTASLGDVLVPTATVDVESGKITPKGKEPAGLTLAMSPNRQRAIASWPGFKDWRARWATTLGGEKTQPRINTDCTLACTSSVIGYGKLAESFLRQNRKIRGIEMEAVGVAAACLERAPLLVIKAISDWANEQKNDMWHTYCADVAADLTISLIQDETI